MVIIPLSQITDAWQDRLTLKKQEAKRHYVPHHHETDDAQEPGLATKMDSNKNDAASCQAAAMSVEGPRLAERHRTPETLSLFQRMHCSQM